MASHVAALDAAHHVLSRAERSEMVPLSALLRRSREPLVPTLDVMYKQVTVKHWGKGAVLRDTVEGERLRAGTRFLARRGQVIVSKIDARNGALAIVPEELDGAVVTNDFPLFDIEVERVRQRYLGWVIRSPNFIDACRRASEGTTNRVRLDVDKFLRIEIPVPDRRSQDDIVEILDAADAVGSSARDAGALAEKVRNRLVVDAIPL